MLSKIIVSVISTVVGGILLAVIMEDARFAPKPEDSTNPQITKAGVALVFAPPSNVRKTPNGEILCRVTKSITLNIYGSNYIYSSDDIWYSTDICGEMGVIHSSQIKF